MIAGTDLRIENRTGRAVKEVWPAVAFDASVEFFAASRMSEVARLVAHYDIVVADLSWSVARAVVAPGAGGFAAGRG